MATRPSVPRSRAGLRTWRRQALARMARSRAATLALVSRLPEAEVRRPRTQGAWSIQDVLVHVAAWEEEGARRLTLIARGRGDRIVWYDTMAEADRFNARAVRWARRLSWPRVLARLARARARLVGALRQLPPAALADRSHALPVVIWLREFAWTHERAHRGEIRHWRATRRQPSR